MRGTSMVVLALTEVEEAKPTRTENLLHLIDVTIQDKINVSTFSIHQWQSRA